MIFLFEPSALAIELSCYSPSGESASVITVIDWGYVDFYLAMFPALYREKIQVMVLNT